MSLEIFNKRAPFCRECKFCATDFRGKKLIKPQIFSVKCIPENCGYFDIGNPLAECPAEKFGKEDISNADV